MKKAAIMPATLPLWILKKQRKLEQTRPRFLIGDIVFVDNSKVTDEGERDNFTNGLGVIIEVSSDTDGYGIDFGPKKGQSWWYPDKTLVLISSHIFTPA